MMVNNMASSPRGSYPARGDKEPLPGEDTQKLRDEIKEEERGLKRPNRELSGHISKGERDKAQMKIAGIRQERTRIQTARDQIKNLSKPAKAGGAEDSSPAGGGRSGRPKFDQFVKSGGQPGKGPGIYHLEAGDEGRQRIVVNGSDAAENRQADTVEGRRQAEDPNQGAPASSGEGEKPEEDGDAKNGPEPTTAKVTTDFSHIDREIKGLKERSRAFRQQLARAGGDLYQRRAIEAQLSRIDAELKMKDTDEYRKRNARVRVQVIG